jgi:hypothetical protein
MTKWFIKLSAQTERVIEAHRCVGSVDGKTGTMHIKVTPPAGSTALLVKFVLAEDTYQRLNDPIWNQRPEAARRANVTFSGVISLSDQHVE